MRKIILTLLLLTLSVGTWAEYDFEAFTPEGQRLYYAYENGREGGSVRLTYPNTEGAYWTDFEQPTGSLKLPATVTYDHHTYRVTSVGDHAFEGCTGLTAVSLPNTVTAVGRKAFAFCSNLNYLKVPASVTGIGEEAFSGVAFVIYCGEAAGGPWGAQTVDCIETELIEETSIYCDSMHWQGRTLFVSGTYYDTVAGAEATMPDTVFILYLTVIHTYHQEIYQEACESFYWDGTDYTESGVYALNYAETYCDSIVTLHLTINHGIHTDIFDTACDSYAWNGGTCVSSGDYTYYVGTGQATECPHAYTLHLTLFNTAILVESPVESPTPYEWRGCIYRQSGSYSDTVFGAVKGFCDSIYMLDLTIGGYEGLSAAEATPYTLTASRGMLTVRGAAHETVRVYDLRGRLVASTSQAAAVATFALPASGAYLVQIANRPAERVVLLR